MFIHTILKLLAAWLRFGDIFFSSFAGTRQSGVSRPNWEHFCPPVSRITCLIRGNQPPSHVLQRFCNWNCVVKRGVSSANVIIVSENGHELKSRQTFLIMLSLSFLFKVTNTASHVTLSTISDTMITSADEAPHFATLRTNYRIGVTHGWGLISNQAKNTAN
eukprot:sb/3472772/